jgi:phosphoheptose isomerase
LNSGATITFGTPGDVIDITECINEHDMRVCSLIGKIRDDINKHSEEELEVSKQVNNSHQYIHKDVETSDNKDHGSLELIEDGCE